MLRQDFHSARGFVVHFRNRFCVPALIGSIVPHSAYVPAGRLSFKVIPHPEHPITMQTVLENMKNLNEMCVTARKPVPFAGVEDSSQVCMIQRAQKVQSRWHFNSGPASSNSPLRFSQHSEGTLVFGAEVAPNQRGRILKGVAAFLKAAYPSTSIMSACLVYDAVGYRSFSITLNNYPAILEIAKLPKHVSDALVKVGLPRTCSLTLRDTKNFPSDGPKIDVESGDMAELPTELPGPPDSDFIINKEHEVYFDIASQLVLHDPEAGGQEVAAPPTSGSPPPPPPGGGLRCRERPCPERY
jgi:hypothetical protein